MRKLRVINAFLLLIVTTTISVFGKDNSEKYITDSIPQQWTYSSEFSQTIPTEDSWWKSFEDPTLDSLISIGVRNNYNILIAQKRMQMAKAQIDMAKSNYMPDLNISMGWNKARTAGAISSNNYPNMTSEYFSLGMNMSWQIDLFGQIRKQVEVSKNQWKASRSQYEGAIITLCGNLATAYINLRTYQTEYEVAIRHSVSQKIVYELTEARFKSGLASKLDVAQAQMVYYATIATIPSLQASIQNYINAIAILIGEYPMQIRQKLKNPNTDMQYRQIVSVGVPMELLRRRPDISQAEYDLAAAAASLGVAKKAFLPILTLDGSIGFQSKKIDNIFKDDAFVYTVQPKLSWNVFDGLYRKYTVVSAREQLEMQIENYNYTIMTAYQDVEGAMNNYKYALISIDSMEKAMNQSKLALDLSVELYKKGLSSFTNVMNSMMSYLQYNNSFVTAKGQALLSLVSLYEALGGGWETNYQISK